MPNINSLFPSKYLKAADLKNRVTMTIDKVVEEKIGNDKPPVAYFRGKIKGLVLNKTNGKMIAEIARSAETDDWPGIQVDLYPTRVDFQGRRVDTIRVDHVADVRNSDGSNRKPSDEDDIDF
jgi:hypothetical protein